MRIQVTIVFNTDALISETKRKHLQAKSSHAAAKIIYLSRKRRRTMPGLLLLS